MNMGTVEEYLLVVWKDNKTNIKFTVGFLYKYSNGYQFEYNQDNLDILNSTAFQPLVAFPDLSKRYSSQKLFATFLIRVPDKRRKDIKEILNFYKLKEYCPYALLKNSGGKLPIDSLEFVIPTNALEREE